MNDYELSYDLRSIELSDHFPFELRRRPDVHIKRVWQLEIRRIVIRGYLRLANRARERSGWEGSYSDPGYSLHNSRRRDTHASGGSREQKLSVRPKPQADPAGSSSSPTWGRDA